MSYLPDVNASSSFSEDDEEEDDMEDSRASSSSGSIEHHQTQAVRKPSNDTPALDNFGVDMTKAAQEGRLDPVVGREKEIERLAQILSRRKRIIQF